MSTNLRLRIVLISAGSLTVMAGAAVSAALPSITENFDSTPNAALLTKLVITLPAICIAIFSPLMGWLTDSLGRKIVLIFSLLLYLTGGVFAIWSSTLTILLLCRALLGIGVAGIATSVNAIIADQFKDEERNIFISHQSAATAIAGVVFISIGGWLATFGWQFPFYVYFLATPVLLMVFYNINYAATVKLKSINEISLKSIPTGIYTYYIIIFFTMLVFYMIPVQMPYLLTTKFHLSSSYIGMAISLAIFASALSSWNFSKLQRAIPIPLILILAILINGAAYIIIAIASNIFIIVSALFISGIGNGLFMPLVTKRVMDLAPENSRGRIMGGLYFFLFIGQFLSPILLSPVITTAGIQSSYGIIGIMLILFAVIFFIITHKRNLSWLLSLISFPLIELRNNGL